ncbi:unnamed protein product [Angiostrongylus costaricensis]|uniref:Uncharacterized protein n=1 Tax=Angiostrongylus costaricensis TaxID=334426 RepID=A0A0R3PIS8_ANGCS|nr:unnamed protein product [Angiostrongylus costaricensis]
MRHRKPLAALCQQWAHHVGNEALCRRTRCTARSAEHEKSNRVDGYKETEDMYDAGGEHMKGIAGDDAYIITVQYCAIVD